MKLLKIEDLEASYSTLKILRKLNLEVGEGEIVAVIGPNGCGKSTMLKCIFGLLKTERGKVIFDAKNITGKRADEVVRLGISYVQQGGKAFKTLSVEENLEMGAYILEDRKLVEERKKEVFTFFPILKEKRKQSATFLSGGQQQMLAIGRALMLKPRMILMDEPSAGLAPNLVVELFKKIQELKEKGITILLVEQNAHLALEIADRAYVLEGGKVAFKGDADKIAGSKIVKDLYLGH